MLSYNWEPMKVVLFFIFSLCFLSNLFAQAGKDFDNSNPELDDFYLRGPYLVYDCVRNHWVCTQKLEHKRCQTQRKRSLLELDVRLPCAHFDEYANNESCVKDQLRLTNEARGDRFCLHPNQKGLIRDY